jgi:hypothetical protein
MKDRKTGCAMNCKEHYLTLCESSLMLDALKVGRLVVVSNCVHFGQGNGTSMVSQLGYRENVW